jgi:hypothetical protein
MQGRWAPEEDQVLRDMYKSHGPKWVAGAFLMGEWTALAAPDCLVALGLAYLLSFPAMPPAASTLKLQEKQQ